MSTVPPIIEILGPWLQNSGDVLNLWSIANRLSSSATLAVSSTLGMDRLPERPQLARVRWPPDLEDIGRAIRSGSPRKLAWVCRDRVALAMAPRSMLVSRGIASGRDIAALLDCSGFAYGDVWSTWRVQLREPYYRRLRQQGTLVIMLPQAFGPFRDTAKQDDWRRLFEQADLIYARDQDSLQHLQELGFAEKTAGVSPDITHLLPGQPPQDRPAWRRRVCIVPNARMIDRTSPGTGDRYLAFLLQSIDIVRDGGLEPHLLIHEKNDMPIAQQIREAANVGPPIINEDALISKGILGACYAVIGSRYHALISALSQGVPAIGTSWSHKYQALFADYGCSDYLLSPEDGNANLESTLKGLFDGKVRDERAARLSEHAERHRAKVDQMWGRIESMIFSRG